MRNRLIKQPCIVAHNVRQYLAGNHFHKQILLSHTLNKNPDLVGFRCSSRVRIRIRVFFLRGRIRINSNSVASKSYRAQLNGSPNGPQTDFHQWFLENHIIFCYLQLLRRKIIAFFVSVDANYGFCHCTGPKIVT